MTLEALVAAELEAEVAPEVQAFAAALAARYGEAARAVLFYGSCLRLRQLDGLMLDFYLLVDRYEAAYEKAWLATANRLIPPNVFYIEHAGLRAKYALLTVEDFHRLCGPETLNVSVWARFAQPSALVWAKDAAARDAVIAAVARAAPALLLAARPMVAQRLPVRELWTAAFALTYDAELRSERSGKGVSLYDSDPKRYGIFSAPALAAARLASTIEGGVVTFASAADRKAGLRDWAKRRREGKLLSAVRLVKASFTFDGGIDYLAWKIARHSGVAVPIRPWQRRHPIVAGLLMLPRLRRSGAIR